MKKIAVIGGGIVGMSTALFLKDKFDVTLFERQKISQPLGAGIMLQPSGLFVLKELGLNQNIIDRGVLINGFHGVNSNGKVDFDISFEDHQPKIYGLGVQRGSVFYELLQAVEESSITFETGIEIIDYSEFRGETSLKTIDKQFDGYDFVIVANGARSFIRDKFPNFYFSKQSGQGAIWTKVNPIGIEKPHCIQQVYHGTKTMLGLMPIGYEQSKEEDYKMNFFFGTSLDYINRWEQTTLAEWKQEVLTISKDYEPYLDQIIDKSQLVCAPYHDVWAKKYSHNNFVFIGDAAHAMSPHLSSGTNLGLLDAYILSEELIKNENHLEGFKLYEKKRKKQLRYYQTISRVITPYFQCEIDRSYVRSHVMKYMYKLPIIRDIMVETITGRRFDLFSRLPSKYYLKRDNK
jgi:2-polyprenyl-6-methoxyphenol hydroxylase-like FAD-dependent oxidoreductase